MSSGTDIVIVGGGPAGAAAAIRLARCGRSVMLVEQSAAAHHKVCGDFLSHEAVGYLQQLAIPLKDLGALPIYAVRLSARREIAACDLPFPALSLTRRSLDEALLGAAAQSGAEIRRGCRVMSLKQVCEGYAASFSDNDALHARAAFLTCGKHDLAEHRRPAGRQNDLVAFKMYFRLTPSQRQALDGFIELYLFSGGYAGLQLVEDNGANLCLLVTRKVLRQCENHWPAILDHLRACSDLLAQRLELAEPLLSKPVALSSIPYGMSRTTTPAGLWPLGDQAAVIPSFSGDGVSIALHSAHLATDFFIRGRTATEYIHQLNRELRSPLTIATALSRLMIAAPALANATRLWPSLLGSIATRTRILDHALRAKLTLAQQ